MIKKIKENRKTLSLVKGTDISDKVYDKEVSRRVYKSYPIEKQLAIITSGSTERLQELRNFVEQIKTQVNNDINGDV